MPSRTDELGSGGSHPVLDETLQPLYDSTFDPVDFLNQTLPATTITSGQHTNAKNGRLPQIQAASSDIQALLSKLNAHNSRCSNSLTQLTDEILRSGSRLAYEVEILRGDVNSLYDVLTDTLQEDIQKFVLSYPLPAAQEPHGDGGPPTFSSEATGAGAAKTQDPEFIHQLRMLGEIKGRLELVIKVFGEALQWPLPPSEYSVTSSLISVSAPELGLIETADDLRAKEVSRRLRIEVTDLLESDGGGYAGWEAAARRVEDLRNLASVWKDTAEEKARARFVDNLARIVDDRKKALDARKASQRPRGNSLTQRASSVPGRSAQNRSDSSNPAAGLFRNLQKLRDEIYLD